MPFVSVAHSAREVTDTLFAMQHNMHLIDPYSAGVVSRWPTPDALKDVECRAVLAADFKAMSVDVNRLFCL